MDFLFTADGGLIGLFIASFLAATLLPGGSEAALLAVAYWHPEQIGAALLLATAGNTLGGMTIYGMGRLLPKGLGLRRTHQLVAARAELVRAHGAPIMLLAWTPLIGDALCGAAGWLRLPPLACALWMAVGKAARYGLLAAATGFA